MKLWYTLLWLGWISCTNNPTETKHNNQSIANSAEQAEQSREWIPEPDILERLQQQKTVLDSAWKQGKLEVEAWVKEPHKNTISRIVNDLWPDSIELVLNIVTDSLKQETIIALIPYSESGDWFTAFKYYFEPSGKVFAFERVTNFYNSLCTEEMAYETQVTFYNPSFEKVDARYTLTDKSGQALPKDSCDFPYPFSHEVAATKKQLLSRYSGRN